MKRTQTLRPWTLSFILLFLSCCRRNPSHVICTFYLVTNGYTQRAQVYLHVRAMSQSHACMNMKTLRHTSKHASLPTHTHTHWVCIRVYSHTHTNTLLLWLQWQIQCSTTVNMGKQLTCAWKPNLEGFWRRYFPRACPSINRRNRLCPVRMSWLFIVTFKRHNQRGLCLEFVSISDQSIISNQPIVCRRRCRYRSNASH